LESIVTGPNDEWPIHPSDEWPIRPDPTPAREGDHDHTPPNLPRIYVAPAESENPSDQPSTKQSRKPQYKRSALFTVGVTVVFGIVYITDFFDGHEVELFGAYAFIVLMGILDIFTDGPEDSKEYREKLDEAKPRRALITDDMQGVIDLSNHRDRTTVDGEWPVLKQQEPKPSFDQYDPDKQSETNDQFWPHLPLPEAPTMYERIRRISWVTGCFMLFTTLFSVIIGFVYPDEAAYPEVQLFFGILSGFCFIIAYSEQLFIGGDH